MATQIPVFGVMKIIAACLLAGYLLLAADGSLAQQNAGNETLLLWSEGVPGARGDTALDKPSLTVFLPEEADATGTGVVVFPGGGYTHLAMDHVVSGKIPPDAALCNPLQDKQI